MTLWNDMKDKCIPICLFFISLISILFIELAFNVNPYVIFYTLFIVILLGITIEIYQYIRKKQFYQSMENYVAQLDQKYLVQELLKEPSFLEGRIFYQTLYEGNKAMIEKIKEFQITHDDFKEYLELWIHDVKIPLATSLLITENHKSKEMDHIQDELKRMENYIEQVLYYVRSGTVEKDYFIKPISLETIVKRVIQKNKKTLILKKVNINLKNLSYEIYTDTKWMEFILNQIVSNSIKYLKEKPMIGFEAEQTKEAICLKIKDNGIGIRTSEIGRVFEKGFTGSNGRKDMTATGIGLYLCSSLCQKLEHKIEITSTVNQGTTVFITFPISTYTNDVWK